MQKRSRSVLRAAAVSTAVLSASMAMASVDYGPVVTLEGDGSAALSNAGTLTTIEVYQDGVANQAAPVASSAYASGSLVNLGSSATEAQLANNPLVGDEAATDTAYTGTSAYVYSGGYAAATGSTNPAAATVNRVVGYMTVTSGSVGGATIGASATSSTTYSSANIRGAVGDDTATNFYGAGSATGYRYFNGSSSFSVSNVPSNVRQVEIRNGQLYGSSDTGTGGSFVGIQALGTGMPTPSANASSNNAPYVLITNSNSSDASPESFAMFDDPKVATPASTGAAAGFAAVGYNVIYVADAETGTVANLEGPGIEKWVYNPTNVTNGDDGWSLAYTIADTSIVSGFATPMIAVAGQMDSNGNVVLYGTTEPFKSTSSTATSTSSPPITTNDLLEFTDPLEATSAGSADGSEIVLASSSANTAFRGVALAPVVPEPATLSLLGIGAVGLMARRRKLVEVF